MKRKQIVFLSIFVLLLAGSAPAEDIIKLKNGNSFRGFIRDESDDIIKVEIQPGMSMSFPKADVAEIIRGKGPPPPPPPPPAPKPEPEPPEPQPEPEKPTIESIRQTVARLIHDGKFTEAGECCRQAANTPQLQAARDAIAALQKDAQDVAAIWQKVREALPAMVGKEALFRDGIGTQMVALDGNSISAAAGLSRPVHELDPKLALSLAQITDPAARGMFFLYARKWDEAKQELQAAAAAGADVKDYLDRIAEAVAAAAEKAQGEAESIEKRKTQHELLAAQQKATADVYRLTRRAQEALDDRNFHEALKLLQEARAIAAQALPTARVKKIDQNIQEIVETSRIILEIEIQDVYVPPGQLEFGVEMERKATRERGERWSKEQRKEVEEQYRAAITQQVGNGIAMAVSQSLHAFGYLVIHPEQLRRGDRASTLKIAYRECAIVDAIYPWTPPMPGPVWPVYGVAIQLDARLEILDPFGREVWKDEVILTTPFTTGDGTFMSQGGRDLFLQRLQMLTFRPKEE
ncbi:MAG: hypothetical protein AB1696_18285 [Planctomycetota bacterium]